MFSFEKRIVDWMSENIGAILFVLVSVSGMLIRYFCRDFISIDANGFLLPWYDEISAGGISSLSNQVGDYNIPYQFLIYIMTLLPIKAIYAYKLLSVVFDYLLAIMVALIVYSDSDNKIKSILNNEKFLVAYALVLINPLVFMNSSLWAQCDSIYTFFIIASVYAFLHDKYTIMWMLYGISISFKLQAIFVLPFILVLYVKEKKYSLLNILFIPLMLIVTSLPGIVMGRSFFAPFKIYLNQTNTYNAISWNYNSFWNCIIKDWPGINGDYSEYRKMAVLLTLALLGVIGGYVIKSLKTMNTYRTIFMLHILVYTAVLFLPDMHDRYGYVYEITGIMLLIMNRKLIFSGAGLILVSCMTYGSFLFGLENTILLNCWINVGIYVYYLYIFIDEFSANEIEGK